MAKELNVRQKPERFVPRVVTMDDGKGNVEKVYQVAPGRFQRRADVENRIARLAEIKQQADAAKADPPIEQLREAFARQMTRRAEQAEQVRAKLAEVLSQLAGEGE